MFQIRFSFEHLRLFEQNFFFFFKKSTVLVALNQHYKQFAFGSLTGAR